MALFFRDQYVQLNGEEVIIPSHIIKEQKNLKTCIKNNKLYINGYKYDEETKTFKKTLIAKWLMLNVYNRTQIVTFVIYLVFITSLLIIFYFIK